MLNSQFARFGINHGIRGACVSLLAITLIGCSSGGSGSEGSIAGSNSANNDLSNEQLISTQDGEINQANTSPITVDEDSVSDIVNDDAGSEPIVSSSQSDGEQANDLPVNGSNESSSNANDVVTATDQNADSSSSGGTEATTAIDTVIEVSPERQPLINSDNYNELIVQAFEIFSGRAFDARLNDSDYAKSIDPIHCSSGSVDTSRENERIYSDCMLGGELLNGSLLRNLVFNSSNLIFTDFTSIQGDDFQMHVDGQYNRKCCVSSPEFHTVNLDYDFIYSDGRLVVNDSSTYKSAISEARIMGGSFSMQPPNLSGSTIFVSVQSEFSGPLDSSSNYETGTLVFAADDGSSMVLNANNSDAATVDVSIANSEGTQNVVESWQQYQEAINWSQPVEVQVLHRNTGDVMNLLAGSGLDLLANKAVDSISKAIATAASVQFGDSIETVDAPSNLLTITTRSQETHYQCANSGSMIVIDSSFSSVETDGFFNASLFTESDIYQMFNCVFFNPETDGHMITLNGNYIVEVERRAGRNNQINDETLSFESFNIVDEREIEGVVQYFADAQLAISAYNNNGESGGSRVATIEEYEKINANGLSDWVGASEFSQFRVNNTFSGRETFAMNVSGQYTGRYSDNYVVNVSTLDDFDEANLMFEGAPIVEPEIAPNGQFSMESANGDSLNIVIQPTGTEEGFYLANFNSVLAEGNVITLENQPFYRYSVDSYRFAR